MSCSCGALLDNPVLITATCVQAGHPEAAGSRVHAAPDRAGKVGLARTAPAS